MDKKRILFVCTHNSARSQMAEGLVNALYGDRFQAFSAGMEATAVRPAAILVMAEIGIDISGHRSKGVNEFINQPFDYIVTVCDTARQSCPFFPGGKEYRHVTFEDPAACRGTEQDILTCFRRSRDEIRRWVEETFVAGLGRLGGGADGPGGFSGGADHGS
jgi:arsenate reductase